MAGVRVVEKKGRREVEVVAEAARAVPVDARDFEVVDEIDDEDDIRDEVVNELVILIDAPVEDVMAADAIPDGELLEEGIAEDDASADVVVVPTMLNDALVDGVRAEEEALYGELGAFVKSTRNVTRFTSPW